MLALPIVILLGALAIYTGSVCLKVPSTLKYGRLKSAIGPKTKYWLSPTIKFKHKHFITVADSMLNIYENVRIYE